MRVVCVQGLKKCESGNMMQTTIAELYDAIGAVVKASTGRDWWRKARMRSRPAGVYALIYITTGTGVENDVVETQELTEPLLTGEILHEVVWGTTKLIIEVEFFSSKNTDFAETAAKRFSNSLRLSARFYDLWKICGLIGSIDYLDFSAVFRGDTEERVRISFNVYANITDEPLDDTNLFNIEQQRAEILHIRQDRKETNLTATIVAPTEEGE